MSQVNVPSSHLFPLVPVYCHIFGIRIRVSYIHVLVTYSIYCTLQMKGKWESKINAWFEFMYSQNETVRPRHFQNRIIMFCLQFPHSCICQWIIWGSAYECRNWERGRAVSFLGIHKSDFQYRYLQFLHAIAASTVQSRQFFESTRPEQLFE